MLQMILIETHSGVRWLVILAALVVLVKHVLGLVQKSEYDRFSSISFSAFSGLMDLNVLIGLIQLIAFWSIWSAGGFPRQQVEHLTVMLIATIVAHLPSRLWKDKAASIRYRNGLFAVIGVLVLVFIGVSVLPGNRWF
ncbi:MAG: hypothetical protein IT326_10330 [Anaerolineae bacterium]|nr:hypothetical protein [Anaerolineae bacterium]